MCVQMDGRVRVHACVCTSSPLSPRARRNKNQVNLNRPYYSLFHLISVRVMFPNTKVIKENRVVQDLSKFKIGASYPAIR